MRKKLNGKIRRVLADLRPVHERVRGFDVLVRRLSGGGLMQMSPNTMTEYLNLSLSVYGKKPQISHFISRRRSLYVNGRPHLGYALEVVQADVLARVARESGSGVVFNIGTDEHGRRSSEAIEAGVTPQAYCDGMVRAFVRCVKRSVWVIRISSDDRYIISLRLAGLETLQGERGYLQETVSDEVLCRM